MPSNIPRARAELLNLADRLERFLVGASRRKAAATIRRIVAKNMHKAPATKKSDPILMEVKP